MLGGVCKVLPSRCSFILGRSARVTRSPRATKSRRFLALCIRPKYERVERLQESFRAVSDRFRSGEGAENQDRLLGGRTKEADLLGLKSVASIFSGWDFYMHHNTFRNGSKDWTRKQYFYPWWTQQEESTPTDFGGPVKTGIVAFAVNANFEALSRLTYASLRHHERIFEHTTSLASIEAWRGTFANETRASIQALQRDLARLDARPAPLDASAPPAEQVSAPTGHVASLEARLSAVEHELRGTLSRGEKSHGHQEKRATDGASDRGDEMVTRETVDTLAQEAFDIFRREQSDFFMKHIHGAVAQNRTLALKTAGIEHTLNKRLDEVEGEVRSLAARLKAGHLRAESSTSTEADDRGETQRTERSIAALVANHRELDLRLRALEQPWTLVD